MAFVALPGMPGSFAFHLKVKFLNSESLKGSLKKTSDTALSRARKITCVFILKEESIGNS